ncbi:107-domain-containing protein [Pyronema omphalodes]|nr:107-domain-containing protein [Pyronema omphalodes]
MAPIFGERQKATRKPANGSSTMTSGVDKPAFVFNAPSSTQSNGFFRTQEQQALPQNQSEEEEEGWDMGDDAEMDDSRAISAYDEEEEDEPELNMQPELLAFAAKLDESNMLQSSQLHTEESTMIAINLIQAYQIYAGEHVEETAQVLEELENTAVEDLKEDHAQELYHTKEILKYWELEHQTWELFGALISHRLDAENYMTQDVPPSLSNKYAADCQIRNHFFTTDPSFRELTIVLEWLRRYAPAPSADDIENDPLYRGDGGWMYTKERIKACKRLPGRGLSLRNEVEPDKLVTELDPDAPSRQQRKLEDEDEAWEAYLMRLVWGFLRKGEMDNALELCEDAGEFWRAASLSGGADAWDAKIDGPHEIDDGEIVKGNRRRELWKRMCYANASNKTKNMYERAVYGTLCGDIASVLPVCESWEDLLFVHVNALVEGYYSSKLKKLQRIPAVVSNFPLFDAISYHARHDSLNDASIMSRIIDEIAENSELADSKLPLRTIQGSLISMRFHDPVIELDRQLQLFETVPDYEPAADENTFGLDATEPRSLRVIVHILMILQTIGAGFTEGTEYHKAAENVIAGYIMTLGGYDKYELVPLYASRLTPLKAIQVMGKSLASFQGSKSRREDLIRSMHQYGIDVDGCLRQTMLQCLTMTEPKYANTLSPAQGFVFNGFQDEIASEDIRLIRGMEWLMLGSEELRGDLVRSGCEVYKRFLLTGRLSAAKILFEQLNSRNIIPPKNTNGYDESSDEETDLEDETAIAGAMYMEMEGLIASMVELEKWQSTIKKPIRIDRTLPRKLKPLYESATRSLPEILKSFLDEPVFLSMPGVGTIRSLYIPELVIALHRVHVEAGRLINKAYYMNALELAAEIADPERNVVDCFVGTGRLEEYVEEIAAVSKCVQIAAQESGKEKEAIWGVLE